MKCTMSRCSRRSSARRATAPGCSCESADPHVRDLRGARRDFLRHDDRRRARLQPRSAAADRARRLAAAGNRVRDHASAHLPPGHERAAERPLEPDRSGDRRAALLVRLRRPHHARHPAPAHQSRGRLCDHRAQSGDCRCRGVLRAAAAAMIKLFIFAFAGLVHAQPYPSKPIHVVVPSPPGGPPDLIIRMLAPKMKLGQPLVIENRAGAGGIVGTAYVAKTPPDGYTWLFTTASHVNTPPFNDNVPFDPVKDFSHVTLAAQNFGQALIVPPGAPATSVQELVAIARRNPGKLNYGSAGIGTASHIPAELMKSMAGVDIVGVQYKGVAEVMTDVLAGR
ncbi:MAG: hypothetical protein E6H57_22195, partial [Betaproteobacteria bacterium]